jgi:hypothetical protein
MELLLPRHNGPSKNSLRHLDDDRARLIFEPQFRSRDDPGGWRRFDVNNK